MKLTRKQIISLTAASLVLVAVIGLPALVRAQTQNAPQNRLERGTQVGSELIKVNTRPPIPFKPFEVQDPANRKAISRDTVLTLPDGKQVPAGQYYDKLNKLEKEFNTLGYTLKQPRDTKTELQVTPIPAAILQRQVEAFNAAHINSKFEPLDIKSAAQEQQLLIAAPPPTLLLKMAANNTKAAANNFSWSSPVWNYSVGNPSTFAVSLNGKSTLNGTPMAVTVHGEANASGSIFNQQFDLLNATADLYAPVVGSGNVKLAVKVVGISVYNLNQNVTTNWSKTDTLQKTLDKSKTINFSLGPIPMSAKIGAQGTAGFTYTVAIAPIKASAKVAPFVHTTVYAQVGVNVGLAGAGAGANLVFLNTDGNLNGTLGISAKNNKLYYDWSDSYSQNLDMLSGNVYIYAWINVPCWHMPPWCKQEYDWNVFSWSGFKKSGTLFSNSGSAPL